MKIGILGPTGFSGSHCAIELLNRSHDVVGISRTPEKLGKHERYTPVPLALETAPIEDLIATFSELDVLVNAYNPSMGPGVYKTFLETTRRLLLAAKAVTTTKIKANQNFYLISVGGTGSLYLPSPSPDKPSFLTAADSRPFWLAYRRSVADSEAATAHAEERMGPGTMASGMRNYRNARLALHSGKATEAEQTTIKETEDPIVNGPTPIPDLPFAARAAFMMYDSVPSSTLNWSFVSPPGRFRPGPRTGKYEVYVDELPLAKQALHQSVNGNEFEGRLLGVSAADLAVAIADEAEKRALVGKHWSPVSEWEGDEVFATHVRLDG